MGWYDDLKKAGDAVVDGTEGAINGAVHGAENAVASGGNIVSGVINGAVQGGAQGVAQGLGLTPHQTPATPGDVLNPANAASFAQQVQQQSQAAQNLKAAANSPDFMLDPTATQAVIKSLQNAQDKWRNNRFNVVRVATNYQLGSTPGAKVISAWNQKIGEQFVTAYNALGGVYQDQIDALTKAMQNYQNTADKTADSFRKVGETE